MGTSGNLQWIVLNFVFVIVAVRAQWTDCLVPTVDNGLVTCVLLANGNVQPGEICSVSCYQGYVFESPPLEHVSCVPRSGDIVLSRCILVPPPPIVLNTPAPTTVAPPAPTTIPPPLPCIPSYVANADVSCLTTGNEVLHGELCFFSCVSGYEINNPALASTACDNGVMATPVCNPVGALPPVQMTTPQYATQPSPTVNIPPTLGQCAVPSINYAEVRCGVTGAIPEGTSCSVNCNRGFRVRGRRHIVCGGDGTFGVLPHCQDRCPAGTYFTTGRRDWCKPCRRDSYRMVGAGGPCIPCEIGYGTNSVGTVSHFLCAPTTTLQPTAYNINTTPGQTLGGKKKRGKKGGKRKSGKSRKGKKGKKGKGKCHKGREGMLPPGGVGEECEFEGGVWSYKK